MLSAHEMLAPMQEHVLKMELTVTTVFVQKDFWEKLVTLVTMMLLLLF